MPGAINIMNLASKAVHKVGFISPPSWFDISPMEFSRIAPSNTIVMQTVMRPPDFDYSPEQFADAVQELKACFDSLAAAGADVVTQFGYPFSLVHGWKKAQQIQKRIQGNSNVSFVMMGVEMIQALKHLHCSSLAVASTYYSGKMSEILRRYLAEAGLDVLQFENWVSQGIASGTESDVFVGEGELDPMDWKTPKHAVKQSVISISRKSPEADCILVTGGGMRLLNIVEDLESEVNKPVISGDLILYWGILRRLGIREGIERQGKLLASLP